MCSHMDDLNARNKCLTAKLLKQGYPKGFYRRHHELVSISMNWFQNSTLTEPELKKRKKDYGKD